MSLPGAVGCRRGARHRDRPGHWQLHKFPRSQPPSTPGRQAAPRAVRQRGAPGGSHATSRPRPLLACPGVVEGPRPPFWHATKGALLLYGGRLGGAAAMPILVM
jgi:hypothetical protein